MSIRFGWKDNVVIILSRAVKAASLTPESLVIHFIDGSSWTYLIDEEMTLEIANEIINRLNE